MAELEKQSIPITEERVRELIAESAISQVQSIGSVVRIGVPSASNIVAGISGKGTDDSSIRFWAGSSEEDRENAPFRVDQAGRVWATNAHVSGEIHSISGSIGGFEIKDGVIGIGDIAETTEIEGMTMTNDFICFRKTVEQNVRDGVAEVDQMTMIGCLSSLGYPTCGRFEMRGNEYALGTALFVECRQDDDSLSYLYKPKALDVLGNTLHVGKRAFFATGYIGEAFSNMLERWAGITDVFLFDECNTSRLVLRLPTKSMMENGINQDFITFIEISCSPSMANTIVLTSVTNGQMYDQNGNTVSTLDMAKGDSVRLMYHDGKWLIVNRNQ